MVCKAVADESIGTLAKVAVPSCCMCFVRSSGFCKSFVRSQDMVDKQSVPSQMKVRSG